MLQKRLLTLLLAAGCLGASYLSTPAAANENNLVQLDGSGSEDADGDRLLYSWRQLSGPRVSLLNADTARPSFHADVAGEYTFELTVSDGRIKSAPAVVSVLIEEANEIPVAVLPSRVSIELGEQAILDGSASSDADNDTLLYNFNQVSGPAKLMSSTVSQEPTFNVMPNAIGTYSFELTVNDGRANSKPALCIVEVVKPNTAPVARVIAPKKTIIKTRHHFNAPQVNAAQALPAHAKPTTTVAPVTTADLTSQPKHSRLKATVKLNRKEELPELVEEISNLSSDKPLNITPIASTSGDMQVAPGSKVVIKGFGVDPDGDSLQFIWNQTSGPMIPGSPVMRKNLAFIPREEGVYVFSLVVNDGKTKSEPASCSITVRSNNSAEIKSAALDNSEVAEDMNALELSIPREDNEIHAQVSGSGSEDDISFRELFSID